MDTTSSVKAKSKAGQLYKQPKLKRNWSELDRRGKQKGYTVTILLNEAKEGTSQLAKPSKRGRPFKFSTETITALVTLKVLLQVSFRGLEGLINGLSDMFNLSLPQPDHTTLCRRMPKVADRVETVKEASNMILAIDSTGLKVFGEGEWKTRMHGYSKRRTWLKLHVLVDTETGQVLSHKVTPCNTHDTEALGDLLPEHIEDSVLVADGAYHNRAAFKKLHDKGGHFVAKFPVNSLMWNYGVTRINPAYVERDRQLMWHSWYGKDGWARRSGYSRRSLVESFMHTFKSNTGDRISARKPESQLKEVMLRIWLVNSLIVPVI